MCDGADPVGPTDPSRSQPEVYGSASIEASRLSLAHLVREDVAANRGHPRGLFIVVFYRIANRVRQPVSRKPRLVAMPIGILYVLVVEWLLGFEMPWGTQVGRRLQLWHVYGTVISPNAVLGDDVLIRHGVTIGNDGRDFEVAPVIGNRVDIGAGAVIVGGIRVGDGASIGANAVVLSDVPAGTTAVGIPARVVSLSSTDSQ